MKIMSNSSLPTSSMQPDRGEQNQREIFAVIARSVIAAREEHGEKGEHQADDFEEGVERRDHEHAVEERRRAAAACEHGASIRRSREEPSRRRRSEQREHIARRRDRCRQAERQRRPAP